MLAHLARFFFFGLHLFDLPYGFLNLGIALLEQLLCLVFGFLDDEFVLLGNFLEALVVVGRNLVETFLLLVHVVALVFPVSAVAHDVEQILVHVDVVAAHQLRSLVDDLLRQSDLAGYLDGK